MTAERMASSDTAALTESYRQGQLAIRAQALRDFLLLWPIWTGDTPSFASLVQATLSLVTVYRQAAAALAASYFQAIRAAAGAPGLATPELAAPLPLDQLAASMYVTGQVMTRDALLGGQPAQQARETALTRISGAITRLILNAGRDTILASVAADEQAVGWARVTDGNPCYFCLTLASRGAVYKSEQAADFQAHDHCACQAVPIFEESALPPLTAQWRDIYDAAQRDGLASGELQQGENSSAARLLAVRHYLEAHPLAAAG